MRGRLLILAGLALAAIAPPGAAWASTYDVVSVVDSGDNNPDDDLCISTATLTCTLRAAVMQANAHANTAAGPDVINLPSETFTLTGTAGDDTGGTGDLDIFNDSVIIQGQGPDNTVVDGADLDRVFDIRSGITDLAVVITGVKVSGGQTTGTGGDSNGAGIRAASSLTIGDVVLTENQASGLGGGLAEEGPTTDVGVSIVNSTIGGTTPGTSNAAVDGGGVAQFGVGTLLISNSRLIGNTASGGLASGGSRGGGAIEDGGGQLVIQFSEVSGNTVDGFGGGGVSEDGGGTVSIVNSLITGNTVSESAEVGLRPHGGGVSEDGGGIVNIINSTITLNSAIGTAPAATEGGLGGGISGTGDGSTSLQYVTMGGNSATSAGGDVYMDDGSGVTALGSIFAGGEPQNCVVGGGGSVIDSQGHNIDTGLTCALAGVGDHPATDPLLAALADNGGFTFTQALLAGSPAIDGGDPNICYPLDQRGAPRQGVCDIGAFEFGSTAPPSQPPPSQPPVQPPAEPKHLEDLPVPKVGKEVNVEAVKGTVLIAVPAGGSARGRGARASQKGLKFVPLEEARTIPTGSYLDTKRGTVQLVSATGAGNKTQDGNFSAGIFQVLQSRKKSEKGLTDLRLKGGSFNRCTVKRDKRGKRASASKLSSRTIRQLKSNAKGRFRTSGKHQAATVRGTIWVTADRCDGTITKVIRGTVSVRDFRRKRTVLVKAGKSYLSRAKG